MLRQSRTPAAERRRAQPCPRAGGGDIRGGGRFPVLRCRSLYIGTAKERISNGRYGGSGWIYPQRYFYPRPPYGGRRLVSIRRFVSMIFLSTSPVWGTTTHFPTLPSPHSYFYPRPPYGGRLRPGDRGQHVFPISIHVPRMGDDHFGTHLPKSTHKFLSTSPVWGTTAAGAVLSADVSRFLSTSPVWGTTAVELVRQVRPHFYPRPPYGGRRNHHGDGLRHVVISIHVPRMGDDQIFRFLEHT